MTQGNCWQSLMGWSLSMAAWFSVMAGGAWAAPQATAIAYQGQLKRAGSPVNETADFVFTLWDDAGVGDPPDGGTQIGDPVAVDNLPVVNGLFRVFLDFGPAAFNGEQRWLQIEVRSPADESGESPMTTLAPRQPLTAVPYALHGLNAGGAGDAHSLDAADGDPSDVVIVDNDGRVGIGTADPPSQLSVDGTIESLAGGFRFPDGTVQTTAATTGNGGGPGAGATSWQSSGADIFYNTGNVGIGTTAPEGPLHVETDAAEQAILGNHTATSLVRFGVAGRSASTGGRGVFGLATSATGLNTGVWGQTASVAGRGVLGIAAASTGETRGVFGQSNSTEGTGVYGFALAAGGTTFGVHGEVASPDGYAGFFEGGRNFFEGNVGIGTTEPLADLHLRGSRGLRVEDAGGAPVLSTGRTGFVGVGTLTPTAALNVESDANLIQGPVTHSDDVVVESSDAVLGLYSDEAGSAGSAISLKEIDPRGPLTDHWAIYRTTASAGSTLRFSYGNQRAYDANPTVLELSSQPGNDAVALPNGSVGAEEIADEPGVAKTIVEDFGEIRGKTTTPFTVASSAINCPAGGFILAIADVRVVINPGPGFPAPDPSRADLCFELVHGSRTKTACQSLVGPGAVSRPVIQTIFAVSAGSNRVDFKISQPETDTLTTWSTPSVTLLFIPTAYGSVDAED